MIVDGDVGIDDDSWMIRFLHGASGVHTRTGHPAIFYYDLLFTVEKADFICFGVVDFTRWFW